MTTISQERAALAKVGRSLRTREQAGFRFDYTNPRAVDEPATRVFVHITITNPDSYRSDDAHARAVEAIGISRFPNTGVSYNRLIMQSGKAYEGQPIGRRGAHTVNDKRAATCSTSGCPGKGGPLTAPSWNLNVNSRAYAICQNVNDAVTDAQLDSLARTIAADMLAGFVRKDAEIHGHRDVANKDCPGSKMWARMGELRRLVDHYLSVGFAKPGDVKPPPTTGDDEMSAQDVSDGIRLYMRDFFKDEQGTGDTIWDESREHHKKVEDKLDRLVTAVEGLTAVLGRANP
jgi:hypothetical protein